MGDGHRHPTLAIVMLPGGQSHAFQGIAIARSMRGRGWRTAMVLPDFDHDNLEGKKLLGGGLETVVYKSPPDINEQFEVSSKQKERCLADLQLHACSCYSWTVNPHKQATPTTTLLRLSARLQCRKRCCSWRRGHERCAHASHPHLVVAPPVLLATSISPLLHAVRRRIYQPF